MTSSIGEHTTIRHAWLPGNPPVRSAGTTPALASDDFPDPLAPVSTVNRLIGDAADHGRGQPFASYEQGAVDLAVSGQAHIRAAGHAPGRQWPTAREAAEHQVQGRVLPQDPRLQVPQRDPRVDTQITGQHRPGPPERVQRLRLTARPIQGENQLFPTFFHDTAWRRRGPPVRRAKTPTRPAAKARSVRHSWAKARSSASLTRSFTANAASANSA